MTEMINSHKAEKLKDIKKGILDNVDEVLAIYLFGSQSAGTQQADSDFDIAILTISGLTENKQWELTQLLASKISTNIDIIDLKQASTVMRMQVISTGQRVYCSDESICEQFEDFVFSDNARLNEERAGILEDIRQRGTVYG